MLMRNPAVLENYDSTREKGCLEPAFPKRRRGRKTIVQYN